MFVVAWAVVLYINEKFANLWWKWNTIISAFFHGLLEWLNHAFSKVVLRPDGMGLHDSTWFYLICKTHKIQKKQIVGRCHLPVAQSPYLANMSHSTFIVLPAVVDVISIISVQFEKVSTAIRKFLFIKGPAKSRWTLAQGWDGQIQGCRGADVGIL